MATIKEVVRNIMEDLVKHKAHSRSSNPQAWLQKVLTKRELAHTRFHYFRRGALGLWVDSSSWLYSLTLKKEKLLAKLSAISSTIKDIHFRIGEIK
jgi:hypothetical protein